MNCGGHKPSRKWSCPPKLRFGDAAQDALLPPLKGMISVLDRVFKGELCF